MPIIVEFDPREDEILAPYFERAEARGRAEGDLEGRRNQLRRLFERRFRNFPDWAAARMATGSAEDLDLWADRVLDCASLEEVFRTP